MKRKMGFVMKKILYTSVMTVFLLFTPILAKASEMDSQAAEVISQETSSQGQNSGIDQPIILLVSLSVVTAAALAISTKKK